MIDPTASEAHRHAIALVTAAVTGDRDGWEALVTLPDGEAGSVVFVLTVLAGSLAASLADARGEPDPDGAVQVLNEASAKMLAGPK